MPATLDPLEALDQAIAMLTSLRAAMAATEGRPDAGMNVPARRRSRG